jgi:hypothetical protein
MRRLLLLLVCVVALAPYGKAQEDGNVQVGAFADYFRSGATGTNMFGLGARVGADLWPHTALEADGAFDFNRGFTNAFNVNGGSASFITSGVHNFHAFFGPRYTLLDHGPIHPFVELKVGFIDYMFNNVISGSTSLSKGVQNLLNDNTNAALLAGGGLEGRVGPVGLRLDVADEMYFNHGAQQGLRVTFGPYIRF